MASAPRIVTRREWGAATTVGAGRFVAPSSRRWFVVHWPVMTSRDERQWCRDVERIHRNQGWAAAPGYNYLVGQSGTVYEGCGRDVRGIHSPPRNVDGWGVCVLQPSTAQGRPTAAISQAARNGTRQLFEWLCTVAGRRLGMTWHGQHFATACPGPDLTAWVRSGMPAQGGGTAPPPPPPPRPQEAELITSALSDNGNFHVWMVGPQRQTIWLTHQNAGEHNWWGGQTGIGPAGFRRFADAPAGRTFTGISAFLSQDRTLHLFATLDDGRSLFTFQRRGESNWPRPLATFAPRP